MYTLEEHMTFILKCMDVQKGRYLFTVVRRIFMGTLWEYTIKL